MFFPILLEGDEVRGLMCWVVLSKGTALSSSIGGMQFMLPWCQQGSVLLGDVLQSQRCRSGRKVQLCDQGRSVAVLWSCSACQLCRPSRHPKEQ